jgi:hypothetical protein
LPAPDFDRHVAGLMNAMIGPWAATSTPLPLLSQVVIIAKGGGSVTAPIGHFVTATSLCRCVDLSWWLSRGIDVGPQGYAGRGPGPRAAPCDQGGAGIICQDEWRPTRRRQACIACPRRLPTRSPVVIIFSAVLACCGRGALAAPTLDGETPLFPLPLSGVGDGAEMYHRAAAAFQPGSLPEGAWSLIGSESFGGVLGAAVRALYCLATSRLRRPLC